MFPTRQDGCNKKLQYNYNREQTIAVAAKAAAGFLLLGTEGDEAGQENGQRHSDVDDGVAGQGEQAVHEIFLEQKPRKIEQKLVSAMDLGFVQG